MSANAQLAKRIRALRHRAGLTQANLAARLGISPSYLNLIESGQRPLSAQLLLKLAQQFEIDLRSLAIGTDAQLVADAVELFGDPLFEDHPLTRREIADFVATSPEIARAVVRLHHAYAETRAAAASAEQGRVVDAQDVAGLDRMRLSSEQVSDFIERRGNHFPELEEEASRVWRDGRLDEDDLFVLLVRYLERVHGVTVAIRKVSEMGNALRRFDPARGELHLSEVLRRGSRNFQLALQLGLLQTSSMLDRLASDPLLTSDESRALCRVALAGYFAAAVLMPYERVLRAAEEERYDIDLLGHRFRASFEQVCQRLTSLRRAGAEGVPFQMIRVDIAGNISKKFSTHPSMRFPRFSGLCPLWNVHAAFLQPGMMRVQLARLPDGTALFSIARTVRKHYGGYHAPQVLQAIGLTTDVISARRLVYADGVNLENVDTAVPIGMSCRICERADCGARTVPSPGAPLRIDENLRGVSFFAPVSEV